MVLVDSSVWVEFLRMNNPRLKALLEAGEVLGHPFIFGELACGNLVRRGEILGLFRSLPQAVAAEHAEAMMFLETNRLMGLGLGYVDIHLLASSRLTGAPLWTRDHALARAAGRLGCGFSPAS